MSKFKPEKLSVEFRDGVTQNNPILTRHCTLTHSDTTAELFLTIGLSFAYDKTNEMKDEVLGKWISKESSLLFYVYLAVDNNTNPIQASIRDYIFRKELPLALEAIRYGDRKLFEVYPKLDNCHIIVHFIAKCPNLNKVEDYGSFSKYNTIK
ncbi:hypothetical protein CSC2_00670 [Clostridium zeae]|uniref:Staygreen protein domain-containing protein n=1 Tax=Clostridium zeae TaxID=2759022 RepID=A0ABQ1E473_9CLOT|nr:staygreen family protein [Clostridium zeae]GFZ29541.1 hypothetical protein CSC2_00670 [Clostridium zeae]